MTDFIPTGILGLDLALDGGGLPRGHLIEIYGPEKCGKTALSLLVVSEAQKTGDTAAFIDIDQTLDAARAARLGVDAQKLIYARPENVRQAVEIARTLARSGALALVVVDSIAGLLTLDREKPDNLRGSSASQILSQVVRELDVIAMETGTSVLFTNEVREQATWMYGVRETTPGGIALKLHAAVRLELALSGPVRSGSTISGEQVQVRVVKPKSPGAFHPTIINIMYNGEISRLDNLFDLAVELKIINQHGPSYSCSQAFLGRGRETAIASLRKQPQLAEEIESMVRKQFLPSSTVSMDEDCK